MDIPIESIEPNPWNPRTTFEDMAMQELVDSIKRFGVLQPICVRPHPTKKGKYQIVYGQRRWVACKKLGLKTIPVKEPITPISDKDAIDMMGDENIKRQAYSPVELAKYIEIRRKVLGETSREIAERYGVDESHIRHIAQLERLPEEIKSKVSWGTPAFSRESWVKPTITVEHARQILRVPQKGKQIRLFKKIEQKGLTVSQLRKEVEKELGIKRVEIPLPPLSDQLHGKTMWNLDRINLRDFDFFTIGYAEREIKQFIEILKKANVKTLVDVREEPVSTFKPEFNKENLEKTLSQNGLKYVHYPKLGVPREIRLKLAKSENWDWFFKWYDENVIPRMKKIDFESLAYPIAIMCVELDPTKCHRHRIAIALERRGLKGLDL
jgi:ParB family chromosome partitioning protein